MTQTTTTFKDNLVKEAGLLSLSKSDCDLFVLAQANTITYQQLNTTGIHGITATSGRLSLKKLLTKGYITDKTLPNSRMKFFVLTAKGRCRLEKLFGNAFLSSLKFDLDRKPPTSQQQLPHRIHTNDLYFSYLSCPCPNRLPIWLLEVRYQPALSGQQQPRCDGFLDTGHEKYFIEQDNCTQGDSALENKLTQYMASELFLDKNLPANTLVFTISAEIKASPVKKPPYSIYRILLKAIRVWKLMEQESGCTLCFKDFCFKFNDAGSLSKCLLSSSEQTILQNLCRQYPYISLEDAILIKQKYLYDTSLLEEQTAAKDACFFKRLRQRFYKILENYSYATLQHRLRKGMRLFVLPNHNLSDNLPFLFQREYCLQQWFPQVLYHMGLADPGAWHYHFLFSFTDKRENTFLFYNAYTFGLPVQCLIIFEDIVHDLGGRERVRFFLRKNSTDTTVLFILFVSNREDAVFFLEEADKYLHHQINRSVFLCFLDKSDALFKNPGICHAYFKENTTRDALWLPAMIDYDEFTNELRLIERRDGF